MKNAMIATMAAGALLIAVAVAAPAAHAQDHPQSGQSESGQEHPGKAQEHPATSQDHPGHAQDTSGHDIFSVASGRDDLSTFVKAAEAAGVVKALQQEGTFTVFVPSDGAFAKLPEGELKSLLEEANRDKLRGILAYHVVPKKVASADLKKMQAETIAGPELAIRVDDGIATVNGAHIVKADIEASNGVIHVIDTVLIPSADAMSAAKKKPKDHPAH